MYFSVGLRSWDSEWVHQQHPVCHLQRMEESKTINILCHINRSENRNIITSLGGPQSEIIYERRRSIEPILTSAKSPPNVHLYVIMLGGAGSLNPFMDQRSYVHGYSERQTIKSLLSSLSLCKRYIMNFFSQEKKSSWLETEVKLFILEPTVN